MIKRFLVTFLFFISPVPVVNASLDPNEKRDHAVQASASLHQAMKNWANVFGYQLVWEVKDEDGNLIDFPISHAITISDSTLYGAVGKVLDSYQLASSNSLNFKWVFFKNNVLLIKLSKGKFDDL